MRKLLIAIAVASVAPLASGAQAAPGPNGKNHHGLCTAYFAGSETGRANKRKAPPFAALEAVSEQAYDEEFGENDASISEKVAWWCGQNAPHPGSGQASGNSNAQGKRAR